MKTKNVHDVLLVGFDYTQDNIPVLIVARKGNKKDTTIVNAFKGNDAKDLYELLMDGKEKYETAEETNV